MDALPPVCGLGDLRREARERAGAVRRARRWRLWSRDGEWVRLETGIAVWELADWMYDSRSVSSRRAVYWMITRMYLLQKRKMERGGAVGRQVRQRFSELFV